MKALLAFALLGALLLAGCSGTPKTDSSSDATGTSASGTATGTAAATSGSAGSSGSTGTAAGTGTSGSGTTSGSAAANKAPVINAFAANVTTGSAPLGVKFTFNATDADKDALTFKLSFGDSTANATGSLPNAGVTHAFLSAGNYTAKFTVSDGKLSVNRTTLVTVLATTATEAGVGQEADLAWDVGFTDLSAATSVSAGLQCEDGPTATFNYDSFTLDVATIGVPFKATITDASEGATIVGWSLYFNLPDCSDFTEIFSVDGAGAITGIVPEGSSPYVFAMSTGGALLEVHYASGSKITA